MRLKAKTEGSKNLVHTRWRGGKGYLRRGKRIGLCCGEKGIPTEREEDRRERGLRV